MDKKICRDCKKTKDIIDFNKNKSKKDGYNNECKECIKDYLKKNRKYEILICECGRSVGKSYLEKHLTTKIHSKNNQKVVD